MMNAIAAQLTPTEMADVAAYFASLPGAPAGEKSPQLANVARTNVQFPEQYKASYTKYHTIDFPDTKQVRVYFANETALKAAREERALPDGAAIFTEVYAAKVDAEGKPVKGGDGHFVAEKLVGYTAMARENGWGRDVPDMLRNENWNYAVFTVGEEAAARHQPGRVLRLPQAAGQGELPLHAERARGGGARRRAALKRGPSPRARSTRSSSAAARPGPRSRCASAPRAAACASSSARSSAARA